VWLENILRRFRRRCPSCNSPTLRNRNWIKATCQNDKGERYPDSWAYESCDTCNARFKRFLNGKIVTPSQVEWRHHIELVEHRR